MRSIVNTALAVSTCETPNIVTAGGQEMKTEAGTSAAQGMESSFKKKLQDCQAMMGPDPQTAASGSITTEDGVQNDSITGVSGIGCIIEGFEMPVIPPGETEPTATVVDAAAAMMPLDGTGSSTEAVNAQANDTPGQIAGTQNTTAGQSPVLTQDEILKTVGAYLDAAAETGTPKPASAAQPQAQTAASPAEQNPAEKPSMAAAEATPESKPVVGVANPQAEARSEGRAEANARPNQAAQNGTAKSDSATADKASQTPVAAEKHDTATQTEAPDKAAQPVSTNAVADARSTAPVTQEAAPTETADTKAAETAHYAKDNVLRIVDKVSTHAADGKYDFDVELKPDFMGKVSIKVTMEGDSIRMQIKTDDMSVKGMLTDQTTSLQNALKDKGITLTSVDVSYENQASLSGEQQQPYERGDGGGRQSSVYYAAQTEPTGYEPAAETYGSYYVGNSSVEFLA